MAAKDQTFLPTLKNRLSVALLGGFPAIVIFMALPFAIFLPNQPDFDYNLSITIPFWATAIILLTIYFIFSLVAPKISTKIAIPLFYFGVFIALSDVIAPTQLNVITGGSLEENINEPAIYTILEVILGFALIFLFLSVPQKVIHKSGPLVAIFFLLSQFFLILTGLEEETKRSKRQSLNVHPPPKTITDSGNIYHIIFDQYSSYKFLKSVDALDARNEFTGFHFFKNNRSNYVVTNLSVPSFLTATIYDGGSLKNWTSKWKNEGILALARNSGYTLSVYAPSGWSPRFATNLNTTTRFYAHNIMLINAVELADIWLVRLAPNFLQNEVYVDGIGFFQSISRRQGVPTGKNRRTVFAAKLMEQLIQDEPNRPDHGQYVYAHLMIPHFPLVLDDNCEYLEKSNYDLQAQCATKLMVDFISTLKQSGKYEKSLIIFQSDHGYWKYGVKDPKEWLVVDGKGRELAERYNLRMVEDNKTAALLLIKPPTQSNTPPRISDRATQLADVAPTIAEFLGKVVDDNRGHNRGHPIFSEDFPTNRRIHIFNGFYQTIAGKTFIAGKNLFEGELNHYSFESNSGWKIHPKLPFQWEGSQAVSIENISLDQIRMSREFRLLDGGILAMWWEGSITTPSFLVGDGINKFRWFAQGTKADGEYSKIRATVLATDPNGMNKELKSESFTLNDDMSSYDIEFQGTNKTECMLELEFTNDFFSQGPPREDRNVLISHLQFINMQSGSN